MRLREINFFLPKAGLYIMLTLINYLKDRKLSVLQFFVFLVAFQSTAFADPKQNIIEEYRAQGYAEQQDGNLYDALTYYTKAVSLGLENAVVFNDLGVLYEEVHMPGRAERFYLRAIQTDAKYLPPYMNLGYLYLGRGEGQLAAEYFKERYERVPRGDPWREKAKEEFLKIRPGSREEFIRSEARQLNEQITAQRWQEFQQQVNQSHEYCRKGDKFLQQKKYREAIAAFDQALERTPDNPKVLKARQVAVLELSKRNIQERSANAIKMLEIGDSRSAEKEIRKMLAITPDEPSFISR